MSVYSIHIPIYDTFCHILIGEKNPTKTLKKLDVLPDHIESHLSDSYAAITFANEKGEPIILFAKSMDKAELVGTLAHEIFHAVHIILQDRDIRLRDRDSNETHCYLIGFIMERVYRAIYVDKGRKRK